MGFCYEHKNPITGGRGRLLCDYCDKAGGVKKVRCPFDYCQAYATCPECMVTKKENRGKPYHRRKGCEVAMLDCEARDAKEDALLKEGSYLRCAALAHGNRVKVMFKSIFGNKWFWMSHEAYDSFALLRPTTLGDYQSKGEVVEALEPDLYSPN